MPLAQIVPKLHTDGILWLVLKKEDYSVVRANNWVKGPVHYVDIHPDNDKLRAEMEPFLAKHEKATVVMSQRKSVKSPYSMPKVKKEGRWVDVIQPSIMVIPIKASDTLYQMALEDGEFERWLVPFSFEEDSPAPRWLRKILKQTEKEQVSFKFITHQSLLGSSQEEDTSSDESSSAASTPERPTKRGRYSDSPP